MLAITAIAVTLSSDQALVIYSGGIVDIPSDDKDVQDLIPKDEDDEVLLHEDIEVEDKEESHEAVDTSVSLKLSSPCLPG